MGNGQNVLAVHPRGRALCSIAAALGSAGYRVLTARVPEQIPGIVAVHPIDVVVASAASRRLEAALDIAPPGLRVVMVVPEGSQPATGRHDALLFEPVEPGHLREVVGALLSGKEPPSPGQRGGALEMQAS